MLKYIAIIASAVSGITAVTTSLRALGKFREKDRYEKEAHIRTGCRISDRGSHGAHSGSSLFLHFAVTVIWFVLSAIFAIPFLDTSTAAGLIQWMLPFLLLICLLGLIWWKTIRK